MNRISAFLLLACCTVCFAQTPRIRSGATVYIMPMRGYETNLAAALSKKHVPLVIVEDRSKADFVLRSNVNHSQPGQPAVVINNSNTTVINGGNDAWNQGWQLGQQASARRAAAKNAMGVFSASISLVDPISSQVIFSYATAKMGQKQVQETAEDCAKHLKDFVGMQKK
jgi:hypothetical protein